MIAQDDQYSFLIFSVYVQGTGERFNCSRGEVLARLLYLLPEEKYLCQT